MTAALLDHLWQSTLFAAAIALIMPLFRGNSAAVRFGLWFAASAKFLVPLSIFTIAGHHLLTPLPPAVPARLVSALQPVAIPFSANAPVVTVAPHLMLIDLAAAAWVAGAIAVLALWLLPYLRLRAHLRDATDLAVASPVPVKSTRSLLEPGLVGIWRPVILMPEGIAEKLSPTEMQAVMAHELCHLRRRDNLLAALHMLVVALFWFHPLVWWLGSRLVEERENACDESVLADGNQPVAYAQGILKVCRFYVQSPLACVSGVSGAELKTRVAAILNNRHIHDVEGAKSALLVSAAALSVMLPLLAGAMGSGPMSHMASRVATVLAAQTAQLPDAMTLPPPQPAPAPHRVQRHAALVAPSVAPAIPQAVPQAIVAPDESAIVASPPPQVNVPPVPAEAPAKPDDSATIVCRAPQPLPASHFSGPKVCRSKGEWIQLHARGKDIGADGVSIVDAASDRAKGCIPDFKASYSNSGLFCF